MTTTPSPHPFTTAPNRTLLWLSIPALFSLLAEPLTGLVDTAFIAQLGITPLAALGVATTAFSGLFWIFNFLNIVTQTDVAQALGEENTVRAQLVVTNGLVLSFLLSLGLMAVTWPLLNPIANLMGASGEVARQAVIYGEIRLLGAPAVLGLMVAFGALRGQQDMQAPLWIALGLNAVNLVLDAVLIFGLGPFPALGIAGSAIATTIAQWLGAVAGIGLVVRRLGWSPQASGRGMLAMLQVGGDLFVRTGSLTLFLVLTTRLANQIGPESGAAHQVIRQVWIFAGLGLDALAISAQSLVGYFLGRGLVWQAKRVAVYGAAWAVGFGVVLSGTMWLFKGQVIAWIVPSAAVSVFLPAWWVAIASQPFNALAFITDGLHWGAGDFRFLRNVMLFASGLGVGGLFLINPAQPQALAWVWAMAMLWIILRAGPGVLRIWPSFGQSKFNEGGLTADH
jgi:MATE family multidrug resistance protein